MRIIPIILALLLLPLSWVYPVFATNQLDVVINEIAWMGTTASYSDEWIELYNTTDDPIALDGWILEAEDGTPKIDLSGTINPKSYYLLERSNNNTISDITADLIYTGPLDNNPGEKLFLKSSANITIDQINTPSEWFAGDNSTKSTMERINPLNPGDNSTNWATNNNSKRNGTGEDGNQINGTPKNQNSVYLVTSTPSPSSTPAPILSPASTPSPTPKPSSLFTLSNIPSQINSDQSFNISVSLFLPNNPNTNFYLKVAFKKTDSSNYFGQTKVSGNWIQNNSSYSNQLPLTTDSTGSWTGSLEVKPDINDSGFTGTGDYIFKVGRYTSTGSGPIWSNEYTIKINDANSSSDTSPVPELPSKVSSSDSPSPTNLQSNTPKISQSPKLTYRLASVAAATTYTQSASPEAKVEVKNQKLNNPFFWIGFIFIFAGISLIGYIYLRKNARNHI